MTPPQEQQLWRSPSETSSIAAGPWPPPAPRTPRPSGGPVAGCNVAWGDGGDGTDGGAGPGQVRQRQSNRPRVMYGTGIDGGEIEPYTAGSAAAVAESRAAVTAAGVPADADAGDAANSAALRGAQSPPPPPPPQSRAAVDDADDTGEPSPDRCPSPSVHLSHSRNWLLSRLSDRLALLAGSSSSSSGNFSLRGRSCSSSAAVAGDGGGGGGADVARRLQAERERCLRLSAEAGWRLERERQAARARPPAGP